MRINVIGETECRGVLWGGMRGLSRTRGTDLAVVRVFAAENAEIEGVVAPPVIADIVRGAACPVGGVVVTAETPSFRPMVTAIEPRVRVVAPARVGVRAGCPGAAERVRVRACDVLLGCSPLGRTGAEEDLAGHESEGKDQV